MLAPMGEFWTSTVFNALGGVVSGVVLLLVAGGFGLLVSRRTARRGSRPSTKEANAFIASSVALSAAAIGTLVIGENSTPVLWVVEGLVVAALVPLDVLIYTPARCGLGGALETSRRGGTAQAATAPARQTLQRPRPGRRRRRVAGRKRHQG